MDLNARGRGEFELGGGEIGVQADIGDQVGVSAGNLFIDDFAAVPLNNMWDDTMGTAERVVRVHGLPHFKAKSRSIPHLFPVVSFAVTDLARDVHVRQKLHLDFDDPVTLAGLAAAAFDVEAKAARLVTA